MFFSDSAAAIYRRWLKSQTALACLAVLLFALSAAFCGLQLEPDYFWHVKLGEWIVQHQSIMEADTFSWTAQEYPVTEFAHSWLGSVVIYLFSLLGRYFSYQHAGAILYELCFYAILFGVLLFVQRQDISDLGSDLTVSSLLAIFPALCTVTVSPRPQAMGYILFALTLYLLRSWEKRKGSVLRVYFLPLIALLWANLHGGTAPMMLAFCAGTLLASFVRVEAGQFTFNETPRKRQIHLAAATGLSGITMLINPYGFKLFLYSFLYNNSACKEGIQEWMPATIYSGFGLVFLALFAVIIAFSNRKFTLVSIVPIILSGGLTLLYVRGTPYLGIAMSFFLTDSLARYTGDISRPVKKGILWGVLLCISGLLLLYGGVHFPETRDTWEKASWHVSDTMANEIKSGHYKRLYNDYNTGGMLIYYGIPVFIDSRADLYPEEVLRDGKELSTLTGNPEEILTRYDFDAILVDTSSPLYDYLSINSKYHLEYEETNLALFEPNNRM